MYRSERWTVTQFLVTRIQRRATSLMRHMFRISHRRPGEPREAHLRRTALVIRMWHTRFHVPDLACRVLKRFHLFALRACNAPSMLGGARPLWEAMVWRCELHWKFGCHTYKHAILVTPLVGDMPDQVRTENGSRSS